MDSPTSITVDTSRLESVIYDLQSALGRAGQPADLSDILRDETRRLVAQIVKLTPPQTKAIGENAVKVDVGRLFSGAHPELIDTIGAEHGTSNIDTFITVASGQKLRLKWDKIDPLGSNMKAAQNAARNRFGKVPRTGKPVKGEWRARIIVPQDARAAHMKRLQSHVGRWKASWAETAAKLGVANIASWIKRHIPTPRSVTETTGLMRGDCPSITFGSRAPGVTRQTAIIRDAVRIRSEAIAKRIKLIVSGYSKDVASGMKIAARAKRSGQGGASAIG